MKKLIGVITAIFVLSALNISEASASNSAVSQDKQSVGINKSSTDKDVVTFNITVNETQLADTLTALHNAGWTITEITKHPTNGTYTIKGEREITKKTNTSNVKHVVQDGVYSAEASGHKYVTVIKDGYVISSTIDGREIITEPQLVL